MGKETDHKLQTTNDFVNVQPKPLQNTEPGPIKPEAAELSLMKDDPVAVAADDNEHTVTVNLYRMIVSKQINAISTNLLAGTTSHIFFNQLFLQILNTAT